MIYKLLYRIPGGHAVQVFTGVCLVLGIGCAPVLYKKTRAGHDFGRAENVCPHTITHISIDVRS